MRTYIRVPLTVEALFSTDGRLRPLKLHVGDETFEVDRVISVRNHCPHTVPCIAPVEYTVQVAGVHKKL